KRRHTVPRRDLGYACGFADALLARAPGARVPAAWQHPNHESRLPRDRFDQSADRSGARGEPAALRFVLSAKHFSNRSAPTPETQRGHSSPNCTIRETIFSATRQTGARGFAGRVSEVT